MQLKMSPANKIAGFALSEPLLERAIEFGGGVSVAREPNCTEVIITLPMLGALG